MDSRKLSYVDQEAYYKDKHHGLLQEFLVLQKECVSKKRKLKEANERKETLLDEIRFLKHRRNLLVKRQSQNTVHNRRNIQPQKMDAQYNVDSSRRYTDATSSGAEPFSQKPLSSPSRNLGRIVGEEAIFTPLILVKKPKKVLTNVERADKRKWLANGEEVAFSPLNLVKTPKKGPNNGKRDGKRKISWQDPLALKV